MEPMQLSYLLSFVLLICNALCLFLLILYCLYVYFSKPKAVGAVKVSVNVFKEAVDNSSTDTVKENIDTVSITEDVVIAAAVPEIEDHQVLVEQKTLSERSINETDVNCDEPIIPQEIHQPDLQEIQKNWVPLSTVERIGVFEIFSPTADTFKWRLKNSDDTLLILSTAEYVSEKTCGNGIKTATKLLTITNKKPALCVVALQDADMKVFKVILKARNGKLIGESLTVNSMQKVQELQESIKALF